MGSLSYYGSRHGSLVVHFGARDVPLALWGEPAYIVPLYGIGVRETPKCRLCCMGAPGICWLWGKLGMTPGVAGTHPCIAAWPCMPEGPCPNPLPFCRRSPMPG